MDSKDKSKEELINDLQKLQQMYNSLKAISDEDFNRRKHAEEKLFKLETNSRAWLENSPVCTKIVDLDFNLQYMSDAGIKGLQIDDITPYYGKPYPFHFYPESFKTEMKGNMIRAKETGNVITQEAPVVDINGLEVWYHSTIVPVKDTNDGIDYLMIVSLDTTERKRAEEALKNSKRDLQAILEATTDGIWKWNFVNNEMYFSPQYYKMLGYEPDEFPATYENWVDLIHPDDRAAALGVAEEYLKTKPDEYENEFRLRTKQGGYQWIHSFSRVAERNPDGDAIAIIGNHYDINNRKISEESLKQSEELFKAIFENSLNPIMIADDAGNYLKVNQAAAGMFHYPVERMLKMNVGDIQTIVSPDAAKRYQEYLAKGFEIGEFDFIRPDNSMAIAQYHAVRVRENFNLSILSDITERKLAEGKLKESEAKYRQLYEFNQMPIAIFDVDTLNFLSVNNAWVDKYGYTKEELLSMTILEIRPESERERVKESVRQVSDCLENVGEYQHKKKNGEIIKVEIIRYDLVFEGKNAKLVFANDITDRKLAEAALEQSRSELKAIYELSPVMMCLVDDNRQVIFANQAFTKFTGTDEERLKGGHACGVFGCINALDDSRGCGFGTNCLNCNLRLAMDDTFKNGTIHTNVEYHTTLLQNGETREVVLLGSTARIESNDQRKLLLCLNDITDRKRAEEALRNSETNYRRLFETLSEGVALNEVIYNEQGEMVDYRILEVNPAFYTTARYDGPVIGRLATDLYQMPASFITDFWRAHKERQTVQLTEMISPVNGRYVLVATSPFLNDRFVTSFFDITERKQAEQELIKAKEKAEESEEKYRLLFENANEAIYIVQNEKFVFTNPACEQIAGISKENLIGYSILDFVEENDKENLSKHHFELINGITKNQNSFFTIINQKGEQRHLSINSVLINWNGLPATLNFGTDITERKLAEDLLLIKAKEIEVKNEEYQAINIELKRANEELWAANQKTEESKTQIQKERQLLFSVLDVVPAFVYLQNNDYSIAYSNKQFNELFEKPNKRLCYEVVAGRTQPCEFCPTFEVFKSRKREAWEWKSPTAKDYIIYDEPFIDSDGTEKVLEFGFDISALKQSEEALLKSEERFTLAMKASNDGLFDWNLETNDIYYSPGWKSMLGYADHELPNDFSVWEISTDPEDVKKSWELQQKLINREIDRFVLEFKMKHKDGHWVNILSRAEAIFNEDGKAVRIVGTHTDITDQKRVEQTQNVIFNISSSIITSKNLEELIVNIQHELGKIVDTSNFYLAFYNEETGMLKAPYVSDKKDKNSEWPAKKSITGIVVREGKGLLFKRKDLEEIITSGKAELIGTISACWLGVPLFVNDKVFGAFAIQSYTDENAYTPSDLKLLEFIADQISIAIHRQKAVEELIVALGKAEESDRLKSAFLANMSHEIRTPMNGILGFADLLKDPELSGEQQQKYIKIIEKSGARMLNIINDIIDISKIEAV
jgi:PAS domain S-box-containing protein